MITIEFSKIYMYKNKTLKTHCQTLSIYIKLKYQSPSLSDIIVTIRKQFQMICIQEADSLNIIGITIFIISILIP